MHTYAVAPVADATAGSSRRTRFLSQLHVSTVSNSIRAKARGIDNSPHRIAEFEQKVRTVWVRLGKKQSNMLLSDVITTAGQKRNLRSLLSEPKPRNNGKTKGGYASGEGEANDVHNRAIGVHTSRSLHILLFLPEFRRWPPPGNDLFF